MTSESLTVTLGVDGAEVSVTLSRDEHGPFIRLDAEGARLEGEAPGLYYIKPEREYCSCGNGVDHGAACPRREEPPA